MMASQSLMQPPLLSFLEFKPSSYLLSLTISDRSVSLLIFPGVLDLTVLILMFGDH